MTGEEFRYSETLARLREPDQWELGGIVDDVRQRLKQEDGEALAVIDHLLAELAVKEVFGNAK